MLGDEISRRVFVTERCEAQSSLVHHQQLWATDSFWTSALQQHQRKTVLTVRHFKQESTCLNSFLETKKNLHCAFSDGRNPIECSYACKSYQSISTNPLCCSFSLINTILLHSDIHKKYPETTINALTCCGYCLLSWVISFPFPFCSPACLPTYAVSSLWAPFKSNSTVMLFGTMFTVNIKVKINSSLPLPLHEFTSYAPLFGYI